MATATRKRKWVPDDTDKDIKESDWVGETIWRLKSEHMSFSPLKLLELLPLTQDREILMLYHVEKFFKTEFENMDEKEVESFKAAVESYLQHHAFQIYVYDVGPIRNIAWSGPFTFGCSFGHDVFRVWKSDNDCKYPVVSMKFQTKEQFWAKLQQVQEQCKQDHEGTFCSAASFRKLLNDDENAADEEGGLRMFFEEMQEVEKTMLCKNCTCVLETVSNNVKSRRLHL